MKNLLFINGVGNTKEAALETSKLISEISGIDFQIFNNETKGIIKDLPNCVNGYTGADLVLANELLNMSKDGSYEDNLVLSHSRGNINVNKALDLLKETGNSLENNVSMINVAIPGSTGDKNIFDSLSFTQPLAKDKMLDLADKVGMNVVGQYNHPLDLVTWDPKAQAAVAGAVGAVGLIAGGKFVVEAAAGVFYGTGSDLNLTPLKEVGSNVFEIVKEGSKALGTVAIGLVPAALTKEDITIYHPIDSYLSESSKVIDSKASGSTGNNLYHDLKNLNNLMLETRQRSIEKSIKAKIANK